MYNVHVKRCNAGMDSNPSNPPTSLNGIAAYFNLLKLYVVLLSNTFVVLRVFVCLDLQDTLCSKSYIKHLLLFLYQSFLSLRSSFIPSLSVLWSLCCLCCCTGDILVLKKHFVTKGKGEVVRYPVGVSWGRRRSESSPSGH